MERLKKIVSLIVVFTMVVTLGITDTTIVSAASEETSTNYVKKITVSYIGGDKDVGETVKDSELKVTGTLKNGGKVTLKEYDILNPRLTSTKTRVTVVYDNKAGKEVKATVSVPAELLLTKIKATLNSGLTFDAGSPIKKSMFKVVGTRSNGKTVTLDESAYDLSVDSCSDKSASTTVKVTCENSLKRTLSSSVVIKATEPITKIKVTYKGGDKDIENKLKSEDFSVIGTKISKKTVEIKDFDIVNDTIEKESNSVKITYENSFGKTLTSTVNVKANLLVKKIKAEYVGGKKVLGDSVTKEDFKVTGTNGKGESVEIKEFEISDTTLERNTQTLKITHVNKLDKVLSASVKVTATNDITSISAVLSKDSLKVGDSIRPADFEVTGTYENGTTAVVPSSKIKLSDNKVKMNDDGTIAPIELTYTSGKTVVKTSVVINAVYITGISATNDKTYFVGDTIKESDFVVNINYSNNTEEKLSSSKYKISSKKVSNVSDVITITYTDAVTHKTYTTSVTLNSNDTTVTDGAQAYYIGALKKIGDSVDSSDFRVEARTATGSTATISDVSISGSGKLNSTSNNITISFTCEDGTKGTAVATVTALDYVTGIDVSEGNGSLKVGESVNASTVDKILKVTFTYKSGEKKVLSTVKNVNNLIVKANSGGAIVNTGSGSVKLGVEGSNNNSFTITYVEPLTSETFTKSYTYSHGDMKYIVSFSFKEKNDNGKLYPYKVTDDKYYYFCDAEKWGSSIAIMRDITGSDVAQALSVTVTYNTGETKTLTSGQYSVTMDKIKSSDIEWNGSFTAERKATIKISTSIGLGYDSKTVTKDFNVYVADIPVQSISSVKYSGSTKAGTAPSKSKITVTYTLVGGRKVTTTVDKSRFTKNSSSTLKGNGWSIDIPKKLPKKGKSDSITVYYNCPTAYKNGVIKESVTIKST